MRPSEIIHHAARLKRMLLSDEPEDVAQGLALAEGAAEPALFDRLLDGVDWSEKGPRPGECRWLRGPPTNHYVNQSLLWRLAASAPPGSAAASARAGVVEVPSGPAMYVGDDTGWLARYPNLRAVCLHATAPAGATLARVVLPDHVTSLRLGAVTPTNQRGWRWLEPDLSALAGHPGLRSLYAHSATPELLAQIGAIPGLEALTVRLHLGRLDADALAPLAGLTALGSLTLEIALVHAIPGGRLDRLPLPRGTSLDLSPLAGLPLRRLRLRGIVSLGAATSGGRADPHTLPAISSRWSTPSAREWRIGWRSSFASMALAIAGLEERLGDGWQPIEWPAVALAPLGRIGSLDRLELEGALFGGVTDLSGLAGLTGLKQLHLMDLISLRDLSGLTALTALETLQLHGAAATSLAGAEGCAALGEVTLSHCPELADATALADLPLERVQVGKCAALKPRPRGVSMWDVKLAAWQKSLSRARARALKAAARAESAGSSGGRPARKKKAPSPRTLMRPIAKGLKARGWSEVCDAVSQARALANPAVYGLLLDGVALDDDGAIAPSKRFTGAAADEPFLRWALYSLLADSNAPEHVALRDGLRAMELVFGHATGLPPRARSLPGLAFLGAFPALEKIALSGWTRFDLSALPPLAGLRSVSLRGPNDYRVGRAALVGLEALATQPALDRLVLRRFEGLTDCSALSGAAALTSLTLGPLDVAALPAPPALVTLDIQRCPELTDLSPLAGCRALETIWLDDTPGCQDLSPLADLPALARVGVASRQAGQARVHRLTAPDLSPLLPALTRAGVVDLEVSRCAVERPLDLSALSELGKLQLSNLPNLRALTGISAPKLAYVQLRSLPAVASLSGLGGPIQELRLDGLGLTSLDGLPMSFLLRALSVSSMPQLADISALSWAEALEILSLGGLPQITELSALAGLGSLKRLTLTDVSVADLSPLATCPVLRVFVAKKNHTITDLSPLAQCPGLGTVNLSGSDGFSDLSPLADSPSIQTLDLFNCPRVTDLTPLVDLSSLRRLHINRNTLRSAARELASLRPDLDIRGEH